MTRRLAFASILGLAAGCGSGGGADGDGAPGDGGTDGSDAIFARDLLEIRIDMDPAMWDELRLQSKSRHSQYGRANCRDAPAPNPYTWFSATVTIDGEQVPFTGVRKKGNIGSQSTLIPSLKLRFDEFVDGQRFHQLDRMALNNSKADPSYARTCLGYAMFSAAGFAAPRCTFAHLVVNGDDLGPYVAIDEVGEQFLARHFERADGNLYEGTASDFRDDAIGGFEQETNQDSDPSRADLAAVLDALSVEDDQLRARLSEVVNLPQFIRFWALESLIWHRDGYAGNANNYFIYADPADGGRFTFIPWGPDAAYHFDQREQVPDSVLAYGIIANRLYAVPAERKRYYQELEKLLANQWASDQLSTDAERVSGIVRGLLPAEAQAEHDTDLDNFFTFVDGRQGALELIMASPYPDWTDGLRVLPCRIPLGAVSGTFTTTWGSLADDAFAAGNAGLVLELDGQPVEPLQGGARAGRTASGFHRVQMVYALSGQRQMTFTASFPDDRWFESYMVAGTHPLRSPPVTVSVLYEDLSVTPAITIDKYEVGEGTWTFEQIETSGGGAVVGSFEGTFYLSP